MLDPSVLYPPVTASPDDDEEERRKRLAIQPRPPVAPEASVGPPPIAPVSAPKPEASVSTAPAVKPVNPAEERVQGLAAQGPPPIQPLHGSKKAMDILGKVEAPKTEERIRYGPQAEYMANLNQTQAAAKAPLGIQQEQATLASSQAEPALKQATTEHLGAETTHLGAETDALRHPQPKQGLTPEETTMHDLMAGGENGQPKINPKTNKPYQYLEAYAAV